MAREGGYDELTMTEWKTFECIECGEVEEIDASEVIDLPACECGGIMECSDGVEPEKGR